MQKTDNKSENLSEKHATSKDGTKAIVSEVVVDRQQWKPVGVNVGSNAEPVRSSEIAESNLERC